MVKQYETYFTCLVYNWTIIFVLKKMLSSVEGLNPQIPSVYVVGWATGRADL